MTRTALGLINWTLLLWNTSWTNCICTCCIRFMDINIAGGMQAATLTPLDNVSNHAVSCSGYGLEGRKAPLLGLSLAELAIRKPIELTLHTGQLLFSVDDQRLSSRQLLSRIEEISPEFMLTVRYCLHYHSKMEASGFMFRADHIILFKEQVIDL